MSAVVSGCSACLSRPCAGENRDGAAEASRRTLCYRLADPHTRQPNPRRKLALAAHRISKLAGAGLETSDAELVISAMGQTKSQLCSAPFIRFTSVLDQVSGWRVVDCGGLNKSSVLSIHTIMFMLRAAPTCQLTRSPQLWRARRLQVSITLLHCEEVRVVSALYSSLLPACPPFDPLSSSRMSLPTAKRPLGCPRAV